MDSEPDQRAGAVSKTDDGLRAAGCKSSTVRHFVPVAQEKSRRLLTGRSKVRLLPGMPVFISSSGPISRGIRLKTGELAVQLRPGGPRNAIRPSAPGPGANGIVPPAKRHGVQVLCVPPFSHHPVVQ